MSDGSARQTFTIEELERLSGLSVSTLRRRIADGSLPVIQPGGHRTRMAFLPNVLELLSQTRRRIPEPASAETPEQPAPAQDKAEKPNPGPDKPIPGRRPKWREREPCSAANPRKPK
jgi:hypothetical protein